MIQHIADGAEHIYLALGATDFRKQQAGLTALVALKWGFIPHSGTDVYIFCNKRHNAIRVLRYDGTGFILATKILAEGMSFQWPKTKGDVRDITKRQLSWLLSGLRIDQEKAVPEHVDIPGYTY